MSTPGQFALAGNTLISTMMMLVGSSSLVYMLDKAEGNAAQVNGHPAWGSVYDLTTNKAQVMDVRTNVFCASGMHLPNGSFVTFGGNGAIGPGGAMGSQLNPGGWSASWDVNYGDFDGTKAIRILNICDKSDNFLSTKCGWFDEPELLSMKSQRWYSAAEATGTGEIVLIGGFTSGGYINRNWPNVDPAYEGGAANPTFEFYPPRNVDPPVMQFMVSTSGLNAYAHTFLMPDGRMFVQANLSTVLWDFNANAETPLPPMPNGVVRVYPASGAVAMLPLTPDNNWTPTILFCGGSDMPDEAWGNYSFPAINTWDYPASKDCQRITPTDPSPSYTTDDAMADGRTMGQFIILPTGKLLILNGGTNGTAGFSQATGQTSDFSQMPFAESLASGPVFTPSLYDPDAAPGQRWSNAGLGASTIPRLYHSTAILLPDASVLVAGSNPNIDVNLTAPFPTNYQAEIFYPPYFSGLRPKPEGMPDHLGYGGSPFDVLVPSSSYTGPANTAASGTHVNIIRPGFTTHAMNMGQRFLRLNSTYTVHSNGSFTLHVSQVPPNPNLFQPGPAFMYVVVGGIPSVGNYVIVGNGAIGTQEVAEVQALPASVGLDGVVGNGSETSSSTNSASGSESGVNSANSSGLGTGAMVGLIVAAAALLAVIAGIAVVVLRRRRRQARVAVLANQYPMVGGGMGVVGASAVYPYANVPSGSHIDFSTPYQQTPRTDSFVNGHDRWQEDDLGVARWRDDVPVASVGANTGYSRVQ